MSKTTDLRWIAIPEPFGQSHEFGCCNAFVVAPGVGGTACGYPRRSDGTCGDGHPAMPSDARLFRIGDLKAAERVVSA